VTHRTRLPQLDGGLFLTDGGIETTLIFHEGLELPEFAAFDLLKDAEGTEALRRYYEPYAELAHRRGTGLVLESPTWRANPHWAEAIGYSREQLDVLNRRAIELMAEIRERHRSDEVPIVISGCIGPHADAYRPETRLTAEQAREYHGTQVATFADTAADMVTPLTLTYAEEAVGIARAAADHGLPVAISFTVETDGRLPDGSTLAHAIRVVDDATDRAPAFFMVNCAHPTHVALALDAQAADDGGDRTWLSRVQGVRANASTRSHAELDAAEDLDEGDPAVFGREMARLHARVPSLRVLGGCCGTDQRHILAVAREVTAGDAPPPG
jgi:S-methylmethionine-dependent homocysteine/selenocysteine methylase